MLRHAVISSASAEPAAIMAEPAAAEPAAAEPTTASATAA